MFDRGKKQRILVVEDHDETREKLRKDLEEIGFRVDIAKTAENAERFLNEPKYHAILMDAGSCCGTTLNYELAKKSTQTNPQALLLAHTNFFTTQCVREFDKYVDKVTHLRFDRTQSYAADVKYLLNSESPVKIARRHMEL